MHYTSLSAVKCTASLPSALRSSLNTPALTTPTTPVSQSMQVGIKLPTRFGPRQHYNLDRSPLRATKQTTSLIFRIVLKMEPRSRVKPHEKQDGVKSRTKACPRVANAMILSP